MEQTYRGYKNLDPGVKQQKAAPISILREVHNSAVGPLGIAIAQLTCLAFFFAMRSCEYSKTTANESSKRTKIIRIKNVRFFHHHRVLPHSSLLLAQADYVNITFEFQKNEERNESVGMYRVKKELYLCPVALAAKIVQRVRSYPGSDDPEKRKINQFMTPDGKWKEITSASIRGKLRAAARVIGEATLGFKPEDIGTHSLRSGAAMALYLAKVPTLTIMIIGRWKSDAFLRYIRKQVAQFSQNLSTQMLQNENFYTVPDFQRALPSNGPPMANTIPTPDVQNEGGLPLFMGNHRPIALTCH